MDALIDYTSSPGYRDRFIRPPLTGGRFISGFTLIEILVVISLFGILLGLVIANFSMDERAQLQQENHRLALLLEHAGERARTSGQPLAFIPDRQGYAFKSGKTARWQSLNDDQALRERRFPDGITIQNSSLEGQRLRPNEMLVLSPSGLNSPFRIVLASEHFITAINGNMLGQISEETVAESVAASTPSKESR